jgi:hypothetical protein
MRHIVKRHFATASVVLLLVACGDEATPQPGEGTVTATNKSSDCSLSASMISGASQARFLDGFTTVNVGADTSPTGGFTIVLPGAPAVGSFIANTVTPPAAGAATLELWEGATVDEFWFSTAGTIEVTSVAAGTIELTVTAVTMGPTPSLGGTGTFTLDGSATAIVE